MLLSNRSKIEQYRIDNPNFDTPKELSVIESLHSFLFLIEEGGIYQLFFNSSPDEIINYEASLGLIGASETLKVIQRGIILYEEERGISLKNDRRFLIELNKKLVRLDDWNQINSDYNMINESIDELLFKYYQLHIAEKV